MANQPLIHILAPSKDRACVILAFLYADDQYYQVFTAPQALLAQWRDIPPDALIIDARGPDGAAQMRFIQRITGGDGPGLGPRIYALAASGSCPYPAIAEDWMLPYFAAEHFIP